jgi:hypothetical protein
MIQQLETLYVALESEIANTNKTAKEFSEAVLNGSEKDRKEAIELVNKKFALMDDYFAGRALPEAYYKGVHFPMSHKSSGGINANGVAVMGIESYMNSRNIDNNWSQFFNVVAAEGRTEIEILDWFSKIVHKEYQDGEEIKTGGIGQEAFERMGSKRFGGGAFLLRRLTLNQARYNLQEILRGHQMRELSTKADEAYTALWGATPSATTGFATNIITTVNSAANTLLGSLSSAGYQVNDETPLLLLCNGAHKASVSAAFRTIAGENGSNVLLEYNVQPVFTYNSNVGATVAGTNAGKLILPGVKNIYANFENARVEETRKPSQDATEIIYQYYANWKVKGDQIQVVNFA